MAPAMLVWKRAGNFLREACSRFFGFETATARGRAGFGSAVQGTIHQATPLTTLRPLYRLGIARANRLLDSTRLVVVAVVVVVAVSRFDRDVW